MCSFSTATSGKKRDWGRDCLAMEVLIVGPGEVDETRFLPGGIKAPQC